MKKLIIKIISLCTILITCSVVVFTYIEYNNYKVYESRYSEMYNDTKNELNIYIKSILKENKKKAESVITSKSIDIHKQILKRYMNDYENLQDDITNPSQTSSLTKIFDKNLDNVFVNVNNNSNKVFVISSDKILWNRHLDSKNTNSLKDFINTFKNSTLSNNALHDIINMNLNKNFIFWQLNNNMNIESTHIDQIIEEFYTYGMENLKKYEILIPVYITNNGDIFGTRDFNSLGKKNKNYKIIIIQRMNIHDALKPYENDIMYFENNLNKIKRDIYINKKEKTWSIEVSLILILFILLISGYLQNRLDIENK